MVSDRPGSATQAVLAPGARAARPRGWVYVRVPSVPRLLSALMPVLTDRLQRSVFLDADAEVVISMYRSSVVLGVEHGHVVSVSEGPAVHEPDKVDAVGVAPDLVPMLLFGEGGVAALADHPDVFLGPWAPLMAALFPPLSLDLLTW